jgi:hypothetical protein
MAARTEKEVVEGEELLAVFERDRGQRHIAEFRLRFENLPNCQFCLAGQEGQENAIEAGRLWIDRDNGLGRRRISPYSRPDQAIADPPIGATSAVTQPATIGRLHRLLP